MANYLNSVAAVSPDNIWAVGGYSNGGSYSTLVEHWDGTAWSLVSSPNLGTHSMLWGVVAISANNVWAVGQAFSSYWHTLVLHWDGTSWTVVPSPGGGPTHYLLEKVAAVSASDIWAVGFSQTGSNPDQILVIHWDGSAWSTVTAPNFGSNGSLLLGVAALSTNDVWAVGYYATEVSFQMQPLIEHWDGTAWSEIYSPPVPPNQGELLGLAAASADDVWAVGQALPGSLVERYSYQCSPATLTPTPSATPTDSRTATATPTVTPVPATYTPGSPTSTPTAAPTCGPDWLMVPVPTVGPGYNNLSGVVSLAADDVWAVGEYDDGQFDRSLALHWDGNQWTSVTVPNYGGYSNNLTSVAASAPDDVWAAGSYYDIQSSNYKGLVAHWNGSQWMVAAHMDLGPQNLSLRAVTAITSSDVWVVGDLALRQSVAFHWDGQAWTRTSTPNPGSAINRLSGVDALSPTNVWAVGDYDNNPGQFSLILHWDGSQWSQVASPSVPPGNQLLASVATITSNDIWAVGYYCAVECGPGHPDETFAIHWDGSRWTRVSTPVGSGDSFLLAVAAVSPTDVWAVGWDSGLSAGLIEHWDGSQWSAVPTPNSLDTPHLYGVSAVSSSNVWAVGTYTDLQSGLHLPLVEHYNLCPMATPSATPTYTATAVPSSTGTLAATSTATAPASVTPTYTATAVSSSTPTGTPTNVPTRTDTPAPSPANTDTATPVLATPTSCTLSFGDVPPDSTFYPYITCLACLGIINGYPCGGPAEPCDVNSDPYFRPANDVTRGQLAKVVSNAAGFSEPHSEQSFEDVAMGNTFYDFIERLVSRGIINGYPCGGTGEPCGGGNLPYFRPSANVTRGQTSKIVAIAALLPAPPIGQQSFEDVPEGSTYWSWIESLAGIGAINGYPCGGLGEPCGPTNGPYFRPAADVTRGQAAKIVSNTFFPSCHTLSDIKK
ncbi:MAG TPA: S-layer homology domain-containing protein [Chloroflexia bacterium]|nr:S-layer homology domain-containing protein [Chloroflexia bacterium]